MSFARVGDAANLSISLIKPLVKGLSESAAVCAFIEELNLPAAILAKGGHDDRLRFLHVNSGLTNLCGFSNAELVGASPELLQGEDTDHEAAKLFDTEIEHDGSSFATLTNYRKDGTPYEVFLLGTRIGENSDLTKGSELFASFAFHLRDIDTVLPRPSFDDHTGAW